MAKVTITFEDKVNGGVKVEATPSVEIMLQMVNSGADLTPAQGYAFTALNAVRKAGRENAGHKILMPKFSHL